MLIYSKDKVHLQVFIQIVWICIYSMDLFTGSIRVSLEICSLYLLTYLLIYLFTYLFIYLLLISLLSHLFICL